MPFDQARELEDALRAQKAPSLFPAKIAEEFVLPAYAGRSLANVAPTLGALFGVSLPCPAPPLAPTYWQGLATGVRRVVLVLLDALGYLQLQSVFERQPDVIWSRLARQGLFLPMTSVYPSTTAAALASLATGAAPLAHGMLGYELWLREYGVLVDMLGLRPVYGAVESLMDWGFMPEAFLARPTVGALLEREGIRSTVLVPAQFTRSALTRICYHDFSRVLGYADAMDMWLMARQALAEETGERNVYLIYWGGVDGAVHRYGVGGGYWQAELEAATYGLEQQLLPLLSDNYREGTLLVMLADHGFVDTPAEAAHDVDGDRVFRRRMLIPFSGESRAAFLHALDAGSNRTLQEVRETLGPDYVVLRTRDVVEAGLFGDKEILAPESRARLGHLHVVARGPHYLDRQGKRYKMRGRHGGLSPEEMLIPWLAVRLDA